MAYKWLERWDAGERDLADHSRRPHASPQRTDAGMEEKVLSVRDAHPAWGARKIAGFLDRAGTEPPAVSTVHAILRRHDRIVPPPRGEKAHLRFEKEAPNHLWQMDFKGWVRLGNDARCHSLTVIDDHSRYVPCLKACGDQKTHTVQAHLQTTFQHYGLPDAMFVDNGTPWGNASGRHWTRLRVWLLKLGIETIYSRPYHPQGRGKNERFHRSLREEVFALKHFHGFSQVQHAFDIWREIYNFQRPHEALGLKVPADRYRPSLRPMPRRLPVIEYDAGEIVRTVPRSKDYISFKGRLWKVPEAFRGERLAIRHGQKDGLYAVCFAAHRIATIDLTKPISVGHVSEQVSAMSPG
jgi:transposase InsO family protein